MVHFFHRGGDTRSCETRPAVDHPGYDLIVTEGRQSHVEHFEDVRALESRQWELRYAWMTHGWRITDGDGEADA